MAVKESIIFEIKATSDDFRKALRDARAIFGQSMSSMASEAVKTGNQITTALNNIKGFEKLKRETISLENEWRNATSEVNRLSDALKNALVPTNKMVRDFNNAKEASRKLKDAFVSKREQLQVLRDSLRDAGVNTRNLAQDQIKLKRKLKETSDELKIATQNQKDFATVGARTSKEIISEIEKVQKAYQRIARESKNVRDIQNAFAASTEKVRLLRQELNRIPPEIENIIRAARGLRRATEFIRDIGFDVDVTKLTESFVEAGKHAEKLKATFGFVRDGAEGANEEIEWLRKVTDELGISFKGSSDAVSKFAAASKDSTLEGQAARNVIIGVSEAASVFKLSADDAEGTFRALQQMMSKGTVTAEELKQQLGDRLPGALGLAAKAMDLTKSELLALMKKGQLYADEFLPRFADQLHKEFAEPAERTSKEATAAIERFWNAWEKLKESLAESGFMDGLARAADNFTETFGDPVVVGTFETLGFAVGTLIGLLSEFSDIIVLVGAGLVAYGITMGTIIAAKAAWAANVLLINNVTKKLIPTMRALMGLGIATSVSGVAASFAGLGGKILNVLKFVGRFAASPVGIAIAGITAAVVALNEAFSDNEEEVAKSRDELLGYKSTVEGTSGQIENLRQAMEGEGAALRDVKKEIATLGDLKSQFTEKQKELNDALAKQFEADRSEKLRELNEKLTEEKRKQVEIQKRLNEVTSRGNELVKKEILNKENYNAIMKDSVVLNEKGLGVLSESITKLKDLIDYEEQYLVMLNKRLEAEREGVNQDKDVIARLEQKIKYTYDKLAADEQVLTMLDAEFDIQQGLNDESRKNIEYTKEEIDLYKEKSRAILDSTKSTEHHSKSIGDLGEELNKSVETQKELEKTAKEVKEVKNPYGEIATSATKAQEKINSLENELKGLEEQIKSQREKIEKGIQVKFGVNTDEFMEKMKNAGVEIDDFRKDKGEFKFIANVDEKSFESVYNKIISENKRVKGELDEEFSKPSELNVNINKERIIEESNAARVSVEDVFSKPIMASLNFKPKELGEEVKEVKKDIDELIEENILIEFTTNSDSVIERLNDIRSEIKELTDYEKEIMFNIALNGQSAIDQLKSIMNELDELDGRVVKVYVDVEKTGDVNGFNDGGIVGNYNSGGTVYGHGSSDTIDGKLTPGEIVIRKERASYFRDLLLKINGAPLRDVYKKLNSLQGYADGGIVGMKGVSVTPNASKVSNGELHRFDIRLNNAPVASSNSPVDQVDGLIKALNNASRGMINA